MLKTVEIEKIEADEDIFYKGNYLIKKNVNISGLLNIQGSLDVKGNVNIEKSLIVNGSMNCNGNIIVNKYIEVSQSLNCNGNIKAKDWIEVGRHLTVNGFVTAGDWIKVGDYIETSGDIACNDALYTMGFSLSSKSIKCKMIHFKNDFKSIRNFWAKKDIFRTYREIILNDKLCYDDIRKKIKENIKLDDIMNSESLHPLEKLSLSIFFNPKATFVLNDEKD